MEKSKKSPLERGTALAGVCLNDNIRVFAIRFLFIRENPGEVMRLLKLNAKEKFSFFTT